MFQLMRYLRLEVEIEEREVGWEGGGEEVDSEVESIAVSSTSVTPTPVSTSRRASLTIHVLEG
jgi:hypothetical protein